MDPLATPEQLAVYTEGKIAADDPRALPALRAISRAVRRRCRWHVAPPVVETLVIDGRGGSFLELPTMYVTAVTAVRSDGVELPMSAVEWSEIGTLRHWGGFSSRYRGIEVDLTHGYQLDDVEDLVAVVLGTTARGLASPMGATREQAGGLSITWSASGTGTAGGVTVYEHERDTVDAYRLP